jgi:acyl carrier protein
MQREQILSELVNFFVRELLDGDANELDGATPLLELGMVDSFSIAQLSRFIDERFGVRIPSKDLNPQNLKDLNTITSLILRLGAAAR